MGYGNYVKEVDGHFIINDETSGGYVDRMTRNFMYHWESKWTSDGVLQSIKYNYGDLTDVVLNKDKTHEDYHKAIRAKNRHFRFLQDFLGLEVKPVRKKKAQEVDIIHLGKSRNERMDEIDVMKGFIYPATISDGFNTYKKYNIHYAELTPEKEVLMNEYNEALRGFKKYQKSMFDKIFNELENSPK